MARPVVGVLVRKNFFRNPKGLLFAQKLLQANREDPCLIYFFPVENIDWINKKIEGYVPGPRGGWRRGCYPFPDVLYDRGAGFGQNEMAAVEQIRRRLKNMPGIQLINACRLEKWPVYERLSRHKEMGRHLPKTIVFNGLPSVKLMLDRYGLVFIKSSEGSGGLGVICLEKKKQGYCCSLYKRGAHKRLLVKNLLELKKILDPAVGREEKAIVQQGIRLVKYKGRRLDLRVLMVKDAKGEWKSVYNQARLAPEKAMITNLALGGEVMNYADILPELRESYGDLPSDSEIRNISSRIVHYIEKEFGPFGEIGLDLAVDESGRVWLLEANSKPSKLPEAGLEDTVGISPQFKMTLDYTRFLFSGGKKGPP